MKIRTGFVSNSSSSSFCIFGISVGDNWEEKLLPEERSLFDKSGLDIEYAINEFDEGQYIGINPEKIDRNKTINEVEKEVLDKIKSLNVGIDVNKLSFIHDGGYNG